MYNLQKKKKNSNYLIHFGILGQKWGIRRYQNPDGSLTNAGKERYRILQGKINRQQNRIRELNNKTNTWNKDKKIQEAQKLIQKYRYEKAKIHPDSIKYGADYIVKRWNYLEENFDNIAKLAAQKTNKARDMQELAVNTRNQKLYDKYSNEYDFDYQLEKAEDFYSKKFDKMMKKNGDV